MIDLPLACNIDALKKDERDHHFDLVTQWREVVEKVAELPTGYAFRFAPESTILPGLAEFVGRERLCCPFFHFEIVVEANGGPIWLRMMGGEEVKSFVRESLLN